MYICIYMQTQYTQAHLWRWADALSVGEPAMIGDVRVRTASFTEIHLQ